jgi:hypothetical protein
MELHMERTLNCLAFLAVVATTGLSSRPAHAVGSTRTLALVVTNNRSATLALPDLQYADDDGARYYRLFRSVADKDSVFLLTTFDRSSASSYPDLVGIAHPPTQAAIEEAVARLASAADAARKNGDKTIFYFVYAGHGDVDNGRGFVDLEDGRIDGQFIESAIIEKIAADTKHVLLDSCNSFFVMNPRKPGGRRWATPKDMALGFAKRHPEVGLFLSTNSDAEVFEWSELESGVFSHEVRSGLSGAADVDGDGNVSYSELAGFVDQANARIARDTLRPHIFYRGPSGEATVALFAPAKAAGRRLVLGEGAMRLWIKSDTGERLLDLHKEKPPMTLVLPGPANQSVSIYVEKQAAGYADRPVVNEHDAPAGDGEIRLAEVASTKPKMLARGDHLFMSLFSTPYGPLAYHAYLAARAAEAEPVFGVSDRDVTRMHHYISEMADTDRKLRLFGGGTLLSFGGILSTAALVSYADSPHWHGFGGKSDAMVLAGVGALTMGLGVGFLYRSTPGELVLDAFESEVASGKNKPAAFAKTEQALEDLAKSDRRLRNVWFALFETIGAGYATWATVALVWPAAGDQKLQPSGAAFLYGMSAFFMGAGFAIRHIDLPTERMLKLYRTDPDLQVRVGVVPTSSGAMVGLSGGF